MDACARASYSQQGFFGPFDLLSQIEARRIATLVRRRVLKRPSPVSGQPVVKHRHLDTKSLLDVCLLPKVLELAGLLGDELMIWNSTLFDKEGDVTGGRAYPWHRESYYWKIAPLETMSFWLALERAHEGNGCMEFLPGSHTWDVPMTREPSDQYSSWFAEGRADETAFCDEGRVSMAMEAGQCVVFSEHLLHRSFPNVTGEHRLGFAFRIAPTYVKVDHPFPCLLISGKNRAGNLMAAPPTSDPAPDLLAVPRTVLRRLRRRLRL